MKFTIVKIGKQTQGIETKKLGKLDIMNTKMTKIIKKKKSTKKKKKKQICSHVP
jgi:hypothetical protein